MEEEMSLALSVKRIEESCEAKGRVNGSFILDAPDCSRIAFMLRPSHRRIRLSLTDYNGSLPDGGIAIDYEIDSHGFDSGTVFKGFISVVSDQGEDKIPVTLSVIREEMTSSKGPVRNLFHFTNLAKEDFEEATRLFYTDKARKIFKGGDRETFFKYRAFSACGGKNRKYEGVEEFLVETGKKNPVLLSFAEGSVMAKGIQEDEEYTITVRKSGWGFPGFTLSCTDDFVRLHKDEYYLDDFEGNFAEVTFTILHERLHAGHNFARIELKSLHSEVVIPVFVDMSGSDRSAREKVRQRKASVTKLMNEFINFRIGNISGDEWIMRSNKLVERMLTSDRNDPESRLMQAQLLLAAKRYSEADIVLGAVEREMDNRDFSNDLTAYYIYLRAMCDQDDRGIAKAVKQVWELYNRSDDSWRILWILIYLDETIKMSPERERSLIEEQTERGMRSPLMYLEAYSVLSHDPTLIRRLSEFEINVLGFAVKHGLMKKEIADQVSNLSQRMRGYDARLVKIMGAYYNEFKDDEMLTAICSYLIRNEITDSRYFTYFEKAVERDLGVTNLYDYYLYTMKRGGTKLLPKNVLMYYSFRNDLPPEFRSYVYANMIVNEEEAGVLLTQSMEDMGRFAASEVLAGHMDENLAIIVDYIRYFRDAGGDDSITDTYALDKALIKNGFLRLIIINDPRIRTVTVTEDAFGEERSAAVKGGRAYLSIYDNDYELFFEDYEGRRYGNKYVASEDIKLLRIGELIDNISNPEADEPGLWVALSEKGRSYISIDGKNVRYVRAIIDSDLFDPGFKEGLLTELLRFYFDNDMQTELSDLLLKIDAEGLTMEERNEYIRFCSMRDDDEEAYRVIKEYGSYGMDARILMRIATKLIEEGGIISESPEVVSAISDVQGEGIRPEGIDPVLTEVASATFRGNKYNESILDFLSRHYEGTTRELKDIWRACKDFDADASVIEGRIIEQMLATGAYIGERDEIFFDYLKSDASKRVVGEYFLKAAEDNFLKDTVLDDRLFMGLLDFAIDEEITDVEALCLIRFYEGRRDMRSDKILYPYIRDLAERDIVFDFFVSYKDLIPALALFSEDVFIEHRAERGLTVTLNYCLETDNEDAAVDYKTEEMKELYPGMYQARGTIFPGETMQYYITVSDRGAAASDIERSEERLMNGDKRYDILQDAITSLNMGDTDSFTELCEDYIIKDRIVRDVIWAES